MSEEKKIFALVKWIGGAFDNTFTPAVPVEWIKDFDPQNFMPEDEDEDLSYVVEWRENKKGRKPKSGWKCYDAQIIAISCEFS